MRESSPNARAPFQLPIPGMQADAAKAFGELVFDEGDTSDREADDTDAG